MKTMRTLSITMLLAGCGLHATDTGLTDTTTTGLGDFVIVDNYQGQSCEGTFGSDESMEDVSVTDLGESEQEFFDGFTHYFDQSKIDVVNQDQQETVIEPKQSIVPTVITVSAVVGVGYVVYKYATKNKCKKAEQSTMKAALRQAQDERVK